VARSPTVHRLEISPPPRRGGGGSRPRQVVDVTLRASDRMLLTVEEAAERLSISRAQMWRLISRGDVASLHVGRLRRIEPEALTDYISRMRDHDDPPIA